MFFTILVFFIVLSILVIIHELGHFAAAKLQGIRVEEFGFGLPPRVFGIKYGETLYSLNLLPFGGFVRVFGESPDDYEGKKMSEKLKKRTFAHKKPWQRAIVLIAGVVLNFVLGWAIMSYLFTKGVPAPVDYVIVQEVTENSPAEEAGLEVGDIVDSIVVGDTVYDVNETGEFASVTKDNAGNSITLVTRRGEESSRVAVIPRLNPPEGEGALGIAITNFEVRQYSAWEAPYHGLIESAKITGLIGKELGKTLLRFVTFQEQEAEIAGPVGIAKLTGQAAQQGLDPLLQLIGLLSLNLAVLNILPFPALDGGQLTFVVYEWVTGRKPNQRMVHKANVVGFSLLIGLLILVTVNDIVKLF